MSMKPLLLAAALTAVTTLHAAAAPVELVCNGELHMNAEKPIPINGIHIMIGDDTVQVSGFNWYAATYRIDREKSDAASVSFTSGLWGGSINRYSGELGLTKWADETKKKLEHFIKAGCNKADPLF
jgi:hypothetical protein